MKLIILLVFLISCNALTQKKSHDLERCKENIIIEQSEVISEIEKILFSQDFYIEGENQYYMFEIRLDDKLKVKKIEVVFENNPQYTDQIEELIMQLSFKRISDKQKCQEYILPFIINSRLKQLLYPKDKDFYNVDLPIE
jgi:hypothetical protein